MKNILLFRKPKGLLFWSFALLLLPMLSIGQATLPVFRTAWGTPEPTGWSNSGCTNRTSTFACTGSNATTFDTTNDTRILNFSTEPNQLVFQLKKSSMSGESKLVVTESVDGITYSAAIGTYGTAIGATAITDCANITLPLSSTTRFVRWVYTKASGNCDMDEVSVTGPSALITGGTTSTTAFATTYGTASASQSFAVSGTLLTNDLVATAQAGFEVSRSDVVSYGATASYTAVDANAGGISFLVRLKDNANAGNYNTQNAVVLSSSPAANANIVTSASGNTVSPFGLTITGLDSQDKQFDGNTIATLTGTPTLNGVLFSDDVVLSGTAVANYSSAAVGGPYAITVTGFSLSGTKAGNYSLAQPTVTDRSITPSSLLDQTITFGALTSVVYGDASFQLTASTDNPSGNPIVYNSSNTDVATISGDMVTIVGAGNTDITATQAGSGTHNPAIPVIQNLVVDPLGLTVTGLTATDKIYNGNTTAALTGTAVLSPSPINSDDATLSGTPVANFDLATVGTHAVTVTGYTLIGTEAGNYALTQPSGLSASISQASQTITFNALPTLSNLTGSIDLNTYASSTSGLALSYDSSDTNVATIAGSILTIVGIGPVTITASQAGDTNYAAATSVDQSKTVISLVYLNQFTGASACPTNGNVASVPTNVTGAALSRSTITCTTLTNLFNSTTLNNTSSVNNASYIEFSVTAATGYRLNLTSVSFFRQGSGTAPNQLEVRYSTDGFTTSTSWGAAALTPTSGTVLTWDFADFISPVSGTVTFRMYPYGTQRADLSGASATTGTFRLDDVSIHGTVEAAPPTVTTTSPATDITAISATLGGDVTDIGGSAITGNGAVIALTSVDSNPTIGGIGVTQEVNGSFSTGTGVFTLGTTVALASNKQYSFRAYATNVNGTVYGDSVTFYTLAQTPTTAITVSNPEVDSLDLDLSSASTPNADTQIAIRVQSGSNTYYVQADGTLGASEVWQYENGSSQTPQWASSLTVTGLLSNTLYTFDVKARNGASVETGFGPTANGTTLENLSAFLVVTSPLADFGNVCTTGSNSFGIGSFTFDGANLNSTNLSVGSLSAELTFSLTQNGTYSNPLSIPNSSTSITAQQVWVKFSPTVTGAFSGTVAISGGGLSPDFTFAATGTGVNTPVSVTTGLVTGITSTEATLGGSYVEGCSAVSASGIEYSVNSDLSASTTVAFNASISGLSANTIYYYRAFATDATGTVNGSMLNFTTSGLTAPTANDATLVSHDKFTANWTAVDGATSYKLDVATNALFSTTTNLTEGFESPTFPPTGWLSTGWTRSTSAGDIKNGVAAAAASSTTGTLTTASVAYPSTMTFYLGRSTNSTAKTLSVEVSTTSQASGFTSVMTYDHNNVPSGSYNQYTIDLSAYSSEPEVYVRFVKSSTTTSPWRFDDLVISGSSSYYVPGYQNLDVSNVTSYVVDTNINPTTQYHYRVRAFSTNSTSDNSNTKSVTTSAAPPTFGSVSQSGAEEVCDGSEGTFNVTGLLPNSTSTITYNINGGAPQTFTDVVANLSGFATFAVTLPASSNGLTLTVTQIERTDVVSPILTVTTNNTAVIAVQSRYSFYVDADGDGYGSTATSMECSSSAAVAPTGFATNDEDCDDANDTIFPGATEVNFNGEDEDCDGSIFNGHDEVVSNVSPPSGALAAMTTPISCSVATNTAPYSGASVVHKFRVTRTSPPAAPVEFESATRTFAISELAIAAYAATYEVQATAIVNGEEQPYNGNTATYTTPAAPVISTVSEISTNQCNQTLTAINSYIYASNGPAVVQLYDFEVIREVEGLPTHTQVYTTTVPYFRLTSLAMPATYGTIYKVRSRYGYNSFGSEIRSSYSTQCTITTPSMPTVQVVGTQCGQTLASINAYVYSTTGLGSANLYEFKVTRIPAPGEPTPAVTEETIQRIVPYFRLTMLENLFIGLGKEYTVSVRYRVNTPGVTPSVQFSDWSPVVCSVFTPEFPTTGIVDAQCNLIDFTPSMSQYIYSGIVTGATQYRFRLELFDELSETPEVPVYSQSVDSPNNYITLNQFTGLSSSTTYVVTVSVELYGEFGPFGKDCAVTTPTIAARTAATMVSSGFEATAYPNPFANNFTLGVKTSSQSSIGVKVFDMVGRLVDQSTLNVAQLKNATIGDQYPSGVYNVVITQDGVVKTLRVVKR